MSGMASREGQERYKHYAEVWAYVGMHKWKKVFAMGFHPSEVLALSCADIHVSSVTRKASRSVVRLGGFGLRRVREEEVHACVMWVFLTVFVVAISQIEKKHCTLQLVDK